MTNPIVVQFCHPSLWVEAKTSVNNNGEAGTISANDYIKGDSAFLFVKPLGAFITTPFIAFYCIFYKSFVCKWQKKDRPSGRDRRT